MQMVSHHHHLTHHFWEKETLPSKLPHLHRDAMSRQRSPSATHHNYRPGDPDNKEEKMSSTRETQHPWNHTDHIQRRKHSYLEEQSEYVPSRRDSLFPQKPVLHKRAFSLSNVTKHEHQPTITHQAAVRHQQNTARRLDALNQQLKWRNKYDVDREQYEQRKSGKQTWLSEEIQSKETLLQQKILRAEETMRRLQKERDKSYYEGQKEDRFYSNGYGEWREDRARYGERRERWEDWERKVNGGQRSRETAKWDARGRPLTQEMGKSHRLEKKREQDEYEYRVKDWDREKRNGRRERGMGSGNYVRRGREMQLDGEEEERTDVRKADSSDSMRRDRSHLKPERRKDEDGLYQLTSRLTGMKCAERAASERGSRLQQVQLEEDPRGLVPCEVCQRSFAPGRLQTHMRVCENKRPQRKVFDMSQYRARGTELEEFMKTNSRSKTPERKKSTWRQKHEAFLQTMRQGRGPASAADLLSEYVPCPHCGRRFAPGPAERHLPRCQNIKSRPAPPKPAAHSSRRTSTH